METALDEGEGGETFSTCLFLHDPPSASLVISKLASFVKLSGMDDTCDL